MGALPDILVPLTRQPARSALCLDFDGTLSGIVEDPALARPLPGVPDLLARLAGRMGMVAVISGRPASFLQRVLGPPAGVRLFGLYGLERSGPDDTIVMAPDAAPWADVIDAVVTRARATAPAGVHIEPKGLTVTVHWRAAPEHESWVVAFVADQVDQRGLVAQPARSSIELRPPLAVDKGTVVRALAEGMRAVAAFGDDLGDLPAFAALDALAAGGLAVAKVAVVDGESPPEVAARADLVVDGATGAVALLGEVAQALG
ncbi:MAG TPA: trehalose-phosphatase [Acidimicrobiales bacterium]